MGYIILNKVIGGIKVLHGTSPYIRTTKAEQKTALRGIDTLSLTVESAIQIDFELGDSITVFGKSYSINKPQAVVHSIEGLKHTYEVTLEGAQYKLINAVLFDMGISGKATSTNVDYYANLLEMLRLIVTCANFNEGSTVWILDETSVPVTDRKDFSFTDTNCLDVIQTVCSEDNFDIDFKIIELNGTYTISVGNIGNVLSYEFEIGETKGLYKLEQNPNSENDTVFTRLYYFGSSDNLASDYRNYSKKLLLPTSVPSGVVLPSNIELVNDTLSGLVYLQLKGLTSHISKVITNDDIKPHRTGTVTSIESGNVLVFYDTSMDFDINEKDSFGNSKYLLSGTAAKIHFNTGKLSGNEFTATYRDSDKRFTLASYTDDNGQVYPDSSSTAFQFSVGDEYVILDIVMPNTYVDLAEKNLLVKGIDEITSGCNATFKYTLSIYELFLRKLNTYGTVSNFFNAGDSVKVVNSSMGLNEYIRIQSVTRDWIKPFNYTLELSESQSVSFKQEIVKALTTVNSVIVKNDLSNTAKSKRNWRTTEELLMLLDSVQTEMLLVYNKGGQFDTDVEFTYNVSGVADRITSTNGTIKHYKYVDSPQNGIWNLSGSDTTLTDDTKAYFCYLKCSRTDQTSTVIYSQTKIDVESDASYFHFPYAVVSSVIDGEREATLLKGSTQIIGDAIRTGTIKGNKLLIDLNQGFVDGTINMRDGLIASMIALSSGGTITAGLQGDSAVNTGIWLGGTYQDALNKLAKIIFNKDGSGHLASGKINWDNAGRLNVGFFTVFENLLSASNISFSNEGLEDLSSIAGVTLTPTISSLFSGYGFNAVNFGNSSGDFEYDSISTFHVEKVSTVQFVCRFGANFNCDDWLGQLTIQSSTTQVFGESINGVGGEENDIIVSVTLQPGDYNINIRMMGSKKEDPFVTSFNLNCNLMSKDYVLGSNGGTLYIQPLSTLTKIANNGMFSYWGSDKYMYIRTDYGFEILFGNYGIKCSISGLYKTTNGGASWTNV